VQIRTEVDANAIDAAKMVGEKKNADDELALLTNKMKNMNEEIVTLKKQKETQWTGFEGKNSWSLRAKML